MQVPSGNTCRHTYGLDTVCLGKHGLDTVCLGKHAVEVCMWYGLHQGKHGAAGAVADLSTHAKGLKKADVSRHICSGEVNRSTQRK